MPIPCCRPPRTLNPKAKFVCDGIGFKTIVFKGVSKRDKELQEETRRNGRMGARDEGVDDAMDEALELRR